MIQATDLNEYCFNGLDKLEKLFLNWSPLLIIRTNVFTGMNNLLTLYVNSNEMNMIQEGVFDLPKLITLNLSHNKLTTLSDLTFCKLPNLQELYLNHNKLTRIGQSLNINCLTNIRRIDLNHNLINDIHLLEFAKLSRLEWLDLGTSGFSFVSNENENAETVINMSLKCLRLNLNGLRNPLDLHQLNIFKNLSHLDLAFNLYRHFDLGPSDIKTILPNISKLRLAETEISADDLVMLRNQLKDKNVELYTALYEGSC